MADNELIDMLLTVGTKQRLLKKMAAQANELRRNIKQLFGADPRERPDLLITTYFNEEWYTDMGSLIIKIVDYDGEIREHDFTIYPFTSFKQRKYVFMETANNYTLFKTRGTWIVVASTLEIEPVIQ